jgi:hypothetical protein
MTRPVRLSGCPGDSGGTIVDEETKIPLTSLTRKGG